jgi:hypothetical protein
MSADIYNISDWNKSSSSWKEDISVKVLQRETAVKTVLSLLWIISLNPAEIIQDLETKREIIEALKNSTNNKIMQHIPKQWEAKIIPLNQEWPQEYKKVA